MVKKINGRIGELLLKKEIITKEQLRIALKRQRISGDINRLGEILIEMRYVAEEDILKMLSIQYSTPFLPMITREQIDIGLASILSETFSKHYNLIPISIKDNVITIATSNILDLSTIDLIKNFYISRNGGKECQLAFVIASKYDINGAISYVYHNEDMDMVGDVARLIERPPDLRITTPEKQTVPRTVESRIINLIDGLIYGAVIKRASDIHIMPNRKSVVIKYRIDGQLHDVKELPISDLGAVISRIKVVADLDIAERRRTQNGRMGFYLEKYGKNIDIRVSIVSTINGEKAILRILNIENILTLDKLGITEGLIFRLKDFLDQPQGMILVTGPTGSGKSTTLYAMLKYLKLKNLRKNIVTVEDPIEYILEGITQIQVNELLGLTYDKLFEDCLRQDPDILMLGEIRRVKEARVAIRSALTGHLVLSTLHANDGALTMTRLITLGSDEQKIDLYSICSSILGILSQRLARRICPYCKKRYTPERGVIERAGFDLSGVKFYKGEGCKHCSGEGYLGRVGTFELLNLDTKIKELIFERSSDFKIREAARQAGMKTLREDGLDKVRAGIVRLEEVIEATPNPLEQGRY